MPNPKKLKKNVRKHKDMQSKSWKLERVLKAIKEELSPAACMVIGQALTERMQQIR